MYFMQNYSLIRYQVIGKDYPKPMVDEKSASSECMAKMKDQYAKKLYGDSELKRKAN